VWRKIRQSRGHQGRKGDAGLHFIHISSWFNSWTQLQGEIYVKFDTIESAKKAVQGLNARWFGGKQVSAVFISDAIMAAHQWAISPPTVVATRLIISRFILCWSDDGLKILMLVCYRSLLADSIGIPKLMLCIVFRRKDHKRRQVDRRFLFISWRVSFSQRAFSCRRFSYCLNPVIDCLYPGGGEPDKPALQERGISSEWSPGCSMHRDTSLGWMVTRSCRNDIRHCWWRFGKTEPVSANVSPPLSCDTILQLMWFGNICAT
jgi:hypothetical protein